MDNLVLVKRSVVALCAAAALAFAPSALASGGAGGGGVNSGGGGGGGGKTVPAPVPSTSCAKITSFSSSDRLNWGLGVLLENPYTIVSSCTSTIEADASYVNSATGTLEFQSGAVILPGTTAVGTLEYPGAPFSTSYTITLSVHDLSFNPLTSTSTSFKTRKANQNATAG